jgi:hypothetical protein
MRLCELHGNQELRQCQRMLNFTDLASVPLILCRRSPIGCDWQ